MNIKEAEKLTGVSSRNIRFYEQKGLLRPIRNKDNDYREYSDEDIHTLMLIRILRMLDMPLEQIREVLEGKLSVQTAAAQQSEKLRSQIEKMQTAARFCEELAKEENPNIEALLTRMDEPENREMLSKKWTADHLGVSKRMALALFSGLIPGALGFVLAIPMIIAMTLHESTVLVLSLILPAIWIGLGFYFHRRGQWGCSLVLSHSIPALLCALMEWQLQLPHEQRTDWIVEAGLSLQSALTYFTSMTEIVQGFWPIFCLLLACFCLGGLLSWAVPIFVAGWKQIYADRKAVNRIWTGFWKKLTGKVPVGLLVLYAVILLPALAVIGGILFGPLDDSVTPENMQRRLNRETQVWVETEDESYEMTSSPDFCERFQFAKWKRKYFSTTSADLVLEVHLHSDRTEPHAIEFYSDGTARIYEAWLYLEEGYFSVPKEVADAVLAYAESVSGLDADPS